MRICHVSPHLPPDQAANALLPAELGRWAAQAGWPDAVANPTSGSSKNGAALIAQYGCGSCHIVPGVAGANGLVGPPLTHMGRRVYIAGMLRNSPENMIAWLENPQAIVAGNVMPRMGLNRNQAQDIAAYLDTLR